MKHTPLNIGSPHRHPVGVSLMHRPIPAHAQHRPQPKPARAPGRLAGLFAKTRQAR